MAKLFTVVGLVVIPNDVEIPAELMRILTLEGDKFDGNETRFPFTTTSALHNVEPEAVLNDLRDRFRKIGATSMTAQVIWELDRVDNLILGAPNWTDNAGWAEENNDKNLKDICKNRR